MYCRYCGNDIGATGKFCQFCGKPREDDLEALLTEEPETPETPIPEEIPTPESLTPEPLPTPEVPQAEKPPRQSRGILKWVLVALWFASVAGGWVAALLLMEQKPPQTEQELIAYRQWETVTLTESNWYQYDLASEKLYCWSFREDGTALYGYADSTQRSATTYTLEEGRITVADTMVWTYDELENCYWYIQQAGDDLHRVRIFPARETPDLGGSCYDYIADPT